MIQILFLFFVAAVAQDSFVPGKGQVFMTDPITATQNADIKDDSPAEDFLKAYEVVDFPEVLKNDEGFYFLKSPYVEVLDFSSPANEAFEVQNGEWIFERGTDGFRSAMAFYHLDANVRYVQSLGFKGEKEIKHTPIKVDPNGMDSFSGTAFFPFTNQIAFGAACIDSVEDADEIHRMYFQALMEGVHPGKYFFGGDIEAIVEGFADYWAASRRLAIQKTPSFKEAQIFQWSSVGGCRPARNLDSVFLTYDIERNYKGGIPLMAGMTNEVWATPLFQTLVQSLEAGLSHEDVDRFFIEGLSLIEADLKMPQFAERLVALAEELYPDKKIADILEANFLIQDLMPRARLRVLNVNLETENLAVGGEGLLALNLSNLGFKSAKAVHLKVSSQSANIELLKESELVSNFSARSEINAGGLFLFRALKDVCMEEAFLEVELTYEGQREPLRQRISFSIKPFKVDFLVGKEIVDDSIEDGLKSRVRVSGFSGKVQHSVKVGMKIIHPNRGDLLVTLHHPQGEKVNLWRGVPTDRRNNIIGVFPDSLRPSDSLDVLTGLAHGGRWKLSVNDLSKNFVGSLEEWSLHFVAETCGN